MLATLIAIATLFTIVLVTHSYILEELYKSPLSETKSRSKITD